MSTTTELLLGGFQRGRFTDSDIPISNGKYKFVYFQEDSVVSVFTGTDNSDQVTAWGIGDNKTIKAGVVLFAQGGQGIKALELLSGSAFVFDEIITPATINVG
jgi:hypothetical protein